MKYHATVIYAVEMLTEYRNTGGKATPIISSKDYLGTESRKILLEAIYNPSVN